MQYLRQHHDAHFRRVPALIVIGIASWIVIGAAFATWHRGHWFPAVIGMAVFLAATALLCREAARHQRAAGRGSNGRR